MTEYNPPTEDLPEFNPLVFRSFTDALTFEDADLRYLRFPIAQGAETIPTLTVGGTLTTGSLTMENVSPAYEIKYPVNNGRIDFYSNTAGGVSTRGGKIDATGVHTNSVFDTIDELAGPLLIGTAFARTGEIRIGGAQSTGTGRTINIGTTASVGTNPVNIAGSVITIGSSNSSTIALNPNVSSALRLGADMTGGTIRIGQIGATTSTTTIDIGAGSNQTGAINIGTGNSIKQITLGSANLGSTTILGTNVVFSGTNATLRGTNITQIGDTNTTGEIKIGRTDGIATNAIINIGAGTLNTGAINIGTGASSKNITIGNITGGTLSIARPITPTYTAFLPAITDIGYQAQTNLIGTATIPPVANTPANMVAGIVMPNGTWVLDIQLTLDYTAGAATSNYFALSFSTVSATMSDFTRVDSVIGVRTGLQGMRLSTTFRSDGTTTYFIVGQQSGGTKNINNFAFTLCRVG